MASSWQQNATFLCETLTSMKKSTQLVGDVRTHFVLLVPITLITLFTLFFQFLLKPLGQVTFVSQMLVSSRPLTTFYIYIYMKLLFMLEF